jgi:hypothetical protein
MQKQVDFQSARAHSRYLLKMWKTNAAARTKREKTAEADLAICRRSPPRTYRAYPARLLADPDRDWYSCFIGVNDHGDRLLIRHEPAEQFPSSTP